MEKIIVETFREGGKVCVNYFEVDGVKYHPNFRNMLHLGFEVNDAEWTQGYVSRKADPLEALAFVAGGSRKGQIFVEMPCYFSTKYCFRQYFTAPAPLVFREYKE